MNARVRLEAELENLERMLPHWRGTLRQEAQFWPQFDVLSQEIIARAEPEDRAYARQRVDAMLTKYASPSRKA